MEYDFSGRIALVSGGSRGIGLAAARRLAAAGASVAVVGRRSESVRQAVAELDEFACHAAAGGGILGIAVDLSELSGVQHAVEATLQRFGGVDILVNCVGDSSYAPFLDLTDEMILRSWTLKVLTAVRLTLALAPIMEARGGGAIVNLSGGAGREPQPGGIPAAFANSGIRVFSKGGAAELARRGIAVNSICPGLVNTDRHLARARSAAEARGVSVGEILRELDAASPTGHVTSAEEVAELILFLASRLVPNLIGAEIVLDAGTSRSV